MIAAKFEAEAASCAVSCSFVLIQSPMKQEKWYPLKKANAAWLAALHLPVTGQKRSVGNTFA
ncbi:hypothetical protein M514_02900 [Trichuris suis]|uniref:Uncharacterized protein n=1 Tax=Trichuris suis TaxID=68888 RepID=A0A085NB00_9BILA|nr:hypothetical protein M513_02900 [Trichuris suis]KFD66646.1 hypothetical protein M514_02900 [Trichuris suis]